VDVLQAQKRGALRKLSQPLGPRLRILPRLSGSRPRSWVSACPVSSSRCPHTTIHGRQPVRLSNHGAMAWQALAAKLVYFNYLTPEPGRCGLAVRPRSLLRRTGQGQAMPWCCCGVRLQEASAVPAPMSRARTDPASSLAAARRVFGEPLSPTVNRRGVLHTELTHSIFGESPPTARQPRRKSARVLASPSRPPKPERSTVALLFVLPRRWPLRRVSSPPPPCAWWAWWVTAQGPRLLAARSATAAGSLRPRRRHPRRRRAAAPCRRRRSVRPRPPPRQRTPRTPPLRSPWRTLRAWGSPQAAARCRSRARAGSCSSPRRADAPRPQSRTLLHVTHACYTDTRSLNVSGRDPLRCCCKLGPQAGSSRIQTILAVDLALTVP
jgi:hypothetical protein